MHTRMYNSVPILDMGTPCAAVFHRNGIFRPLNHLLNSMSYPFFGNLPAFVQKDQKLSMFVGLPGDVVHVARDRENTK